MTEPTTPSSDAWSRSALRVGLARAPWGPCEQDGELLLGAVRPHLGGGASDANVVVLGVTPGVVQLDWPAGARLVAADSSPAMIQSQWRANPEVASQVFCAGWQALPLPDGFAAAVVGDGSLNALPDESAYDEVLGEIARVLRPDGVLALRCFINPAPRESVEAIAEAAARRAFANSASFRLRLCMALASEDGALVLGEFLERFNAAFPDRPKLAAAAGWAMDEIDRFDMDRGSQVRLTFPTLARSQALAAPRFGLTAVLHGDYELAERCPTLVFHAR